MLTWGNVSNTYVAGEIIKPKYDNIDRTEGETIVPLLVSVLLVLVLVLVLVLLVLS